MLKYQYKIFENTSLNKDGGKAVFVNTVLIPFKDKEHKVMEKHSHFSKCIYNVSLSPWSHSFGESEKAHGNSV